MSPLLLLLPLATAGELRLLAELRQTPLDPAACRRALGLSEPPEDCAVQSVEHAVLVLAATGCGGDTCDVSAAVVRRDGVHALPATSNGAALLGGTTVLLPGGRAVLTDQLTVREGVGLTHVDTVRVDVDTGAVTSLLDCFSVALGPDGRTLTCRDRQGALLRSTTGGAVPQVVAEGPGEDAVDWAPYKWVMPEAAVWTDDRTITWTDIGPGGEPIAQHRATLEPLPRPGGLDGWVEVPTVFPDPALRSAPMAFLRTKEGCLPARLSADEVEVALCATPEATCTWSHALARTWGPGWHLSCEKPDGSGWGAGGGGSLHAVPRVVRDDAEAIEWALAPELEAAPERERVEERPCTPQSAAAGTEYGRGPARRCHIRSGYGVAPVRSWGGRGMGIAWSPEPVDCREACPADPDGDRVVAASAWLAGRRFVAEDAPRIGLYRTLKGCEEAPWEPQLSLDTSECGSGD